MTPAAAFLALLVAAAGHLAGIPPARARAVVEASTAAVERAPAQAAQLERVTGVRAEALMLAIAIRESALLVRVERCEVTGDHGLAVGLWQEHASGLRRQQLCEGGARAQASLALAHLAWCARGDLEGTLACYAGRRPDHRIVLDRARLTRELAAGAP